MKRRLVLAGRYELLLHICNWCREVYRAAYGSDWEERFRRLTLVDAIALYQAGAGVPLRS